ncbi:tripartite tricarboxylate transporter substrate-binding protein [Ancylobacter sp. MQZ15Z-1]|uniref:Tripartite tricarboxylate transporter substrate-binding protein n=1 Tax=Ancylobacter mangrovi TaxID=2972472 RepID=A0A9X2T7X2_9HYPH|nr:tripartite tricarboxylate transporter substrate-binding protein [Ancylobacter mangrovi]MCS0496553.1 tripartite tricarboxylate transporter substrate-binding protein [Ancylobacter mangrovi]
MHRHFTVAALAASLLALHVPAARAVEPAPAKEIGVIIGYGVGGGYDAYARLLSRHMGKHLPGEPVFLPQNMPGAGSLKAANYIFSVAPKDGSVMGTFAQQAAVAPLLGDAGYDSRKFSWIGSISGETTVCLTSTKSPIATWDDMLTKDHVFGGEGRGSDVDTMAIALQKLFGTKTKLVTGYPGTSEMFLAVERGEIDGLCGVSLSSVRSRFSQLLDEGKIRIILQAGLEKDPSIDVPNVMDFAKTDEQKRLLAFILGPNVMGRPYAAPPGVPPETLALLRKAFDETVKDPEFLADAAKQKLDVRPITGQRIEQLLDQLYTTPKALLDEVAEISGAAK